MYTDGAARWNPGPGGYGTVLMYKGHRKELAGGFKKTTNNRMELLAVIIGLEALTRKDLKIKIYSDSKYVVDAVEKGWLWNWQKQNFKKKKNPDLWKRYIQVQKGLSIDFHWVKGHANIPENERCDELAVEASHQQNLPVDKGYEQD
ncbi:MAG: ribonuclease HI [Bacteroidales bacterium]|nr:ribonuclease HI [Bacteroidales bacterium]